MTETSLAARQALSLSTRLGIAIVVILLLGGAVVMGAALAYGRHAAREAYDRLLIGAANQIAASTKIQGGDVVVDIPVSAFELLALAPDDRVTYRIVDQKGVTVTGYDDLQPPPSMDGDIAFYQSSFGGEPIRVVAVRRRFSERAFGGSIDVLVGQTTRARQALAGEIARSALLVLGVAGIFMAALAIFAVRSAMRPLRQIASELALRKPKDLTPLTLDVPREIGTLVTVINRFMSRLDRQVSIMRSLIADASHQLRTPIAALLAQAQLAAEEDSPDRLRMIVARIRDRAANLGRLTDQLLNHALIIHRADAVLQELVDLRTIAIQTAEESDHDQLAAQSPVRLNLPEDPVWVLGDPLSLVEASKNLVNNALRYGSPPVTLSVDRNGPIAALRVKDQGNGLPEAVWAEAGTRFARNAANKPKGAGLGLAIVQAVAEAHAGSLGFRRVENQGFEASLFLPCATEADQ